MAAVFALDSGKAVLEIAAIQIPLYNLFDMGTKEAIRPFKTIFIDLFQGFKVVLNAAIVRGLFGIPRTVYGCRHGHVPGDCIFFATPLY
jgi:hypothetical protein